METISSLQGNEFLATGAPNPYFFRLQLLSRSNRLTNTPPTKPIWATVGSSTPRLYTTRYWNKQNYQNGATINLTAAKPSGVDKLNGYRHAGDTLTLSNTSRWGIFRTGAWYDWAYTDRYQVPSNIMTWQDTPLPNFHEHFTTQSFMPFAEYEWHPFQRFVITARH